MLMNKLNVYVHASVFACVCLYVRTSVCDVQLWNHA